MPEEYVDEVAPASGSEYVDETPSSGPSDQGFAQWYAKHAKRLGLDPNPDDPRHHYDYRAAYRAGLGPDVEGHWPSKFKADDHPNRYILDEKGLRWDTKTGLPAGDPAKFGRGVLDVAPLALQIGGGIAGESIPGVGPILGPAIGAGLGGVAGGVLRRARGDVKPEVDMEPVMRTMAEADAATMKAIPSAVSPKFKPSVVPAPEGGMSPHDAITGLVTKVAELAKRYGGNMAEDFVWPFAAETSGRVGGRGIKWAQQAAAQKVLGKGRTIPENRAIVDQAQRLGINLSAAEALDDPKIKAATSLHIARDATTAAGATRRAKGLAAQAEQIARDIASETGPELTGEDFRAYTKTPDLMGRTVLDDIAEKVGDDRRRADAMVSAHAGNAQVVNTALVSKAARESQMPGVAGVREKVGSAAAPSSPAQGTLSAVGNPPWPKPPSVSPLEAVPVEGGPARLRSGPHEPGFQTSDFPPSGSVADAIMAELDQKPTMSIPEARAMKYRLDDELAAAKARGDTYTVDRMQKTANMLNAEIETGMMNHPRANEIAEALNAANVARTQEQEVYGKVVKRLGEINPDKLASAIGLNEIVNLKDLKTTLEKAGGGLDVYEGVKRKWLENYLFGETGGIEQLRDMPQKIRQMKPEFEKEIFARNPAKLQRLKDLGDVVERIDKTVGFDPAKNAVNYMKEHNEAIFGMLVFSKYHAMHALGRLTMGGIMERVISDPHAYRLLVEGIKQYPKNTGKGLGMLMQAMTYGARDKDQPPEKEFASGH